MAQVTTVIVGTGGIARHHIRSMLAQGRTTRIVGLVEVEEGQRERTRALFEEKKAPCPPFFFTMGEQIKTQGAPQTAFICTPH